MDGFVIIPRLGASLPFGIEVAIVVIYQGAPQMEAEQLLDQGC